MIVVGIIAILMAIAVPNFYQSMQQSRATTCIANLSRFEGAKEQYAMANNIPQGGPVTMANLLGVYIQGNTAPTCPSGGTYDLQVIGTATTCTITDGPYPHVLTNY
jgi:Tfp pilus assembly protein PilE